MEEQDSPIEGQDSKGILAFAFEEIDGARNDLDAVVAETVADVRAGLDEANDALASVADTLSGEVLVDLGEAEKPVAKLLQGVEESAFSDLSAATQAMFAAGMWPTVDFAQILDDFEADNPTAVAMRAVYDPLAAQARINAGMGSPTIPAPVDPTLPPDIPPPNGVELPTAPAPRMVSEDPGLYYPVAPACPPPQVVVVPVQPCPAPAAPVAREPAPMPRPVEPGKCDPEDPMSPGYPCREPAPEPRPVSPEPAPMPRVAPAEPLRPGAIPSATPGSQYQPRPPVGTPPITAPMSNWDGPERCRSLTDGVGLTAQEAEELARRIAQPVTEENTTRAELAKAAVAAAYGQQTPNWLPNWSPTDAVTNWIVGKTAQTLTTGVPSAGSVAGIATAEIAAAQTLERVTGAPAMYLSQGFVYDLQWARPQFLPSQEQVDELRLTNQIDDSLWECLTRANGNKVWARKLVLRARRTRPNLSQWISLYRRGVISYQVLSDRARENGVQDQSELLAIVQEGEFVPPYTDLIRMMVRDSADEGIVNAFRYDDGFAGKFAGPIKDWARAQGIDESVFRFLWRAHWQLPSPTQLYEMLRRLRPGRVRADQVTQEADVRQALLANDIAPAFVERLMAVSYNTITRTDLLTFLTNGSMSKDEVIERLQDTGYTKADAERIADAWSLEVANRRANRSRVWSRANIVKRYRDGDLSKFDAGRLLSRTIPDPKEVDAILEDVDTLRSSIGRSKCIKGVRRRMFTGEISAIQARTELRGLGVDADVAVTLADGWACEIQAASKEPTVGMLRDWWAKGIITTDSLFDRLLNLRYTSDDATRIVQAAIADEQERRAKAAEQAAAAQQRLAEKLSREATASRRRAIQNEERIAKGKKPLP